MFRSWWCSILALAVVAGCGNSGPAVVPVEGRLTLDGNSLANKSLIFTPIENTQGQGAGGTSDAEGKFTLKAMVPGATKEYEGILPGRYRVMVFEPMLSGDIVAEEAEGEPAAALAPDMSRRKSEVSAIYRTEQSPLIVDVSESGGEVVVELKSKPSS